MSFTLDKIFTTATYKPNLTGYTEIEPCAELKPYIRCFWEYRGGSRSLVIPDLCADVMFDCGDFGLNSSFVGVSNKSFHSQGDKPCFFAIRFYAWSAVLFSNVDMRASLNTFIDAREYFADIKLALEPKLLSAKNMYERKLCAEKYLINRLDLSRENSDLMNSLYCIIQSSGRASVGDLADYCAVSKRTLERRFLENTALTPKEMLSLVRYQLLWQELLGGRLSIQDCVEKFGFYDQPHLLREFKKFHGVTPSRAVELALDPKL